MRNWWAAIEPQILGALDVDLEPVIDVGKAIDPGRTRSVGIACAQVIPRFAINAVADFLRINRMRPAFGVIPKTLQRFGGEEFLNFAREIHPGEAI